MTRRTILVLFLLVLFLASLLPLLAHDAFRVIGVVADKRETTMQVKNKAGKVFTIGLNKATVVQRDKNKISAAELKAGLTVVVDALGDSEEDLVAVEVRIVPAIPAATGR